MDNDQNRVVYIDNMRIVLVYLVVLLHSMGAFLYPLDFTWSTLDKAGASRIYAGITSTLDVFLMPHLIFISVLFIFVSLTDKTKIQYIKKRFKRLYVPVMVFVFCAGDFFFQLRTKRLDGVDPKYSDTFINFWADLITTVGITISGKGKTLDQVVFSHYHLWFMSFLFLITLVIIAIASGKKEKLVVKLDTKKKIVIKAIIFSFVMSGFYICAFGVYDKLSIYPDSWISFFGLTTFRADQFWMLIFFVLFGLYVHKKEWLTKGDIGSWKSWGLFSAVLCFIYVNVTYFKYLPVVEDIVRVVEHNLMFADNQPIPALQSSFILAVVVRTILYPTLCMGLLMFFLSLFKKFLNKPNRTTEFCSKHSINVYILHFIPVLMLQYAFNDVAIPSLLKVILYTFITIPACLWLSYRFVYPYPKSTIAFFVLLKLVSLWAGFDFYYNVLITILFISFAGANVEFFRFKFQKREYLAMAE